MDCSLAPSLAARPADPPPPVLAALARVCARPRRDWMAACLADATVPDGGCSAALAEVVLRRFLEADLSESSEAVEELLGFRHVHDERVAAAAPVLLQVAAVLEVGAPALAVLDVLEQRLESAKRRARQADAGIALRAPALEEDQQPAAIPRRMLKIFLTDGHETVQAMEYRPLNDLDLLTPPGAKILIANARVLRGVLILEPRNIRLVWDGRGPNHIEEAVQQSVIRRLKELLKIEPPAVPQTGNLDSTASQANASLTHAGGPSRPGGELLATQHEVDSHNGPIVEGNGEPEGPPTRTRRSFQTGGAGSRGQTATTTYNEQVVDISDAQFDVLLHSVNVEGRSVSCQVVHRPSTQPQEASLPSAPIHPSPHPPSSASTPSRTFPSSTFVPRPKPGTPSNPVELSDDEEAVVDLTLNAAAGARLGLGKRKLSASTDDIFKSVIPLRDLDKAVRARAGHVTVKAAVASLFKFQFKSSTGVFSLKVLLADGNNGECTREAMLSSQLISGVMELSPSDFRDLTKKEGSSSRVNQLLATLRRRLTGLAGMFVLDSSPCWREASASDNDLLPATQSGESRLPVVLEVLPAEAWEALPSKPGITAGFGRAK